MNDLVESRRLKPMRKSTWFDKRRQGGATQRELKSNPYRFRLTKREVVAHNKARADARKRAGNRIAKELAPAAGSTNQQGTVDVDVDKDIGTPVKAGTYDASETGSESGSDTTSSTRMHEKKDSEEMTETVIYVRTHPEAHSETRSKQRTIPLRCYTHSQG